MTYYFEKVFIKDKYSLLCSKYNNPIIINSVDKFITDYYVSKNTIEEAESKYQEITINGLLNKTKKTTKDISFMIASDLQNQNLASNLCASNYDIPSLNIYSACASFCEGLIIGSKFIDKSKDEVIVTVSSHNLVSEKQFRFPVEYGAIRKMVNACTVTGSISILLTTKKTNLKVESATIGKVTVTNHKDANDMGSAMAPACAKVIYEHLKDTNRTPDYYDVILTGDLGEYGYEIMKKYYQKSYGSSLNNVIDGGNMFYEDNLVYAGASGPTCLPLILFDHILKNKKYKKILIVATGSLHSVTSSNLKLPMPAVAHAVSLEVL